MDLFVISSPLQLINAMEARNHFGIDEAESTLVLTPIQYRNGDGEMLRNISTKATWRRVFEAPIRAQNGPAADSFAAKARAFRGFARALNGIAEQVGHVDRLFLGHYGDKWRRHLANVMPHRCVYVLDDGFATLTACAIRHSVRPANPYGRRLREVGLMRTSFEYLLGARFLDLGTVCFFTAYDIRPPVFDSVIRNTYAHLRSLTGRKRVDDGGILLGSPLVENGMLEEDAYAAVVGAVKLDGDDRPLTYYPHRAEDPGRVRRLAERLNLDLRAPTLPFEWVLLTAEALPSYLAGFHTSALYNCRLIFGDSLDIRAYRPRYTPERLRSARAGTPVESAEGVYAYFERHAADRFRVIDVDAIHQPGQACA